MVRKTVVRMIDDLDGSEVDDGRTVSFAYEGVTYEIDLSAANAQRLHGALASYIAAARRVGGSRLGDGAGGAKPPARPAARTAPDPEQTRAMREWGRTHGFAVSAHGRVSRQLREAYDTAR